MTLRWWRLAARNLFRHRRRTILTGSIVVVGYATVIFNFTGVNLLFDGLHSYADVPGAD